MLFTEKKITILVFTLIIGFFLLFAFSVSASISESFENYNLGNINYQNSWYPLNQNSDYYEWGFVVNTDEASEGLKSIISHPTATDLIGSSELWDIITTGLGIFSFDFLVKEKPNWAMVEFCYGYLSCVDIEIGGYTATTTIKFKTIKLADNYSANVWHRISFQYNLPENWGRASLDFGSWSATTTLISYPDFYFNRYIFRSGGENWKQIYFDNFTNIGECNSTCIYCDFWECQNYEGLCLWNSAESQCQPEALGIPELELPPLEECGELGITDRLLCEIKNFFYRLFVPSSEKITELRNTTDLAKTKFPYNYILETKSFFSYLKENINEEDTSFKIFGQAGTLNLAFWNSTTTLAGYTQSFLDIFKKISSFIILLVLIFWFINFLKRIFK